jgi:hypothetical protein
LIKPTKLIEERRKKTGSPAVKPDGACADEVIKGITLGRIGD